MHNSHDGFRGETGDSTDFSSEGSDTTAQSTLVPGVECARFAPLIEAFHDEALDNLTMRAVAAHLAGCAWCAAQRHTAEQVDALLAAAPLPAIPHMPQSGDLLRARLRERIALQRGEGQPGRQQQHTTLRQRLRTLITPAAFGPAFASAQESRKSQKLRQVAGWSGVHSANSAPTLPGPSIGYRRSGRLSPLGAIAAVLVVFLLSVVLLTFAPKGLLHIGIANAPNRAAAGPAHTANGGCAPSAVRATLPANAWLSDMAMVSVKEGWAVGAIRDALGSTTSSLLLHFSQCHWQQFGTALAGISLNSISMVSPQDGWIAGSSTTGGQKALLHYTNGRWQDVSSSIQALLPGGVLNVIRMRADGEGWLIAAQGEQTPSPGYALYQARNAVWSQVLAPLSWISDIEPVATDEAWAAGQTDNGGPAQVLAHYLHGIWTTVPVPDNGVISALRMLSPSDGWAMGQIPGASGTGADATALLLHYDGTNWTRVDVGASSAAQQVMMFGDSEGWAFGVRGTGTFSNQSTTVVSFAQYDQAGHWQTTSWPFVGLSNIMLVRVADGEYWGFGYDTTQSASHPVLLYFADGSWSEYGNSPGA